MDVLFLLARIIFGGYWLYNGLNHFRQHGYMTQYAAAKGVPAAGAAVLLSGLLIFLGGLLVLLGLWPQVGLVLIILFLLGVTPRMHDFWTVSDPNQRMAEMINFTKNMALLAACVMLLMIPLPWPLSVRITP